MNRILALLSMIMVLFMSTHIFSQEIKNFTPSSIDIQGDWSGVLDTPIMQLTLVLHIEQDLEGTLKAKLDCLEQGISGLEVDSITLNDGVLTLDMKTPMASYKGIINEKEDEFAGQFTQNGISFPLNLKKDALSHIAFKRPQEPKPPYPYHEEEVAFENRSAGCTLSGTLTYPRSEGPFPTVLLIAGSGPVDRNEALMGHKPFLVLADHLTRQGIAVLRVDKRGIGRSTGNYDSATSEDFASDALAGVEYLKSRQEVQQIGLIGHSEGGMIAPMVAIKTEDVQFIVLMAGPCAKCEDVLLEQGALLQRAEGLSEELIERERTLRKEMFSIVKGEPNTEIAAELLRETFLKYLENLPEGLKKEVVESSGMEISDLSNIEAVVKRLILNTRWFRYFLAYDPATTMKQVKVPVLALNGELDLQVSSKQNLPLIAQALEEAGNHDYTIMQLPQHNHLFQVCQTGSIKEYSRIEETISPVVLETVADWILKKCS